MDDEMIDFVDPYADYAPDERPDTSDDAADGNTAENRDFQLKCLARKAAEALQPFCYHQSGLLLSVFKDWKGTPTAQAECAVCRKSMVYTRNDPLLGRVYEFRYDPV